MYIDKSVGAATCIESYHPRCHRSEQFCIISIINQLERARKIQKLVRRKEPTSMKIEVVFVGVLGQLILTVGIMQNLISKEEITRVTKVDNILSVDHQVQALHYILFV